MAENHDTRNLSARQPKHTPGPWTLDPIKKWDIVTNARVITDRGRFPMAWSPAWDEDETKNGGGPAAPQEALANARLIAAAPDLLAALKAIAAAEEAMADAEEYDLEPTPAKVRAARNKLSAAWKKARKAIAKAETT